MILLIFIDYIVMIREFFSTIKDYWEML